MANLSNNMFYFIIYILFSIIFMFFMMIYLNLSTMILFLMIYTIMICLLLSYWSKSPIYSIIIFLTLISGLLIIFLYFTSLISNMFNIFNFNIFIMASFFINLLSILYFILKKSNFKNLPISETSYLQYFIFSTNESYPIIYYENKYLMNMNISNIFFYPYSSITFIVILFLLLTLFSIIKICSIKSYMLRKII